MTQSGEVTIEQAPYAKVSTEVKVLEEGIKEQEDDKAIPEKPIEEKSEPFSPPEQPENVCFWN